MRMNSTESHFCGSMRGSIHSRIRAARVQKILYRNKMIADVPRLGNGIFVDGLCKTFRGGVVKISIVDNAFYTSAKAESVIVLYNLGQCLDCLKREVGYH